MMENDKPRRAIVIGAGPAGLTAASELLDKTEIRPVVIEQSDAIGGISQTVRYNGNRIDIGGHRFFSKNRRVTDFWEQVMPMQGAPATLFPSHYLYIRQAREIVSGKF